MLINANDLEVGSTVSGDVVVIGGGPAGISIALALARAGLDSVLLESGGLEFDAEIQRLAAGTISGRKYHDLDVTRLRYLGGSSNHWGGRCLPLVPHDFEVREWIPHSGWPLDYAVLVPYYQRAHEFLQLGEYNYDASAAAAAHGEQLFPFEDGPLTSVFTRINRLRLGRVYRSELDETPRAKTLLEAHVLRLVDDGGERRVQAADVVSSAGKRFTVRGRAFVIASGGIENPRLLLLSEQAGSAAFGNANDQVGRYFMDHLWVGGGLLVISDPDADYSMYWDEFEHEGVLSELTMAYEASFLAREKLPNLYFEFWHQRGFGFTDGIQAVQEVGEALADFRWPQEFGSHIMTIARNVDTLVDAGAVGLMGDPLLHDHPPQAFRVYSYGEQVPNPASRVRLGDEKDRYDLPMTDLVWRTTELDHASIRRSFEILSAEVGRTGLGRMRLRPDLQEPGLPQLSGGHHHMGTTRMSASPRTGVVDLDCRVHGMANLYVAGSSVFPTSGYANPTLTIVALALRLADHLHGELG